MIYTLTMNPALDFVAHLKKFETGTINRIEEKHIYFGGKGINVSSILKELGFKSTCLGFIGGFTGDELKRGVSEELGLKNEFIKVNQGMTRINVKIHSDKETELNDIGVIIEEKEIQALFQQLERLQENDVLVLSGSIPKGVSKSIYRDILEKLQDKHIKVVVDAEGDLLLKTLPYRPFLIKPNNHELEQMFNVSLKTIEDIEYYARKLQEMGAQNVLISMAKEGSLLIDEYGKSHHLGVCKGTVKNSVGAGDSMVAGFIAGCLQKKEYPETLKLATAAGGATAFSDGLATKDKIEEMLKQL